MKMNQAKLLRNNMVSFVTLTLTRYTFGRAGFWGYGIGAGTIPAHLKDLDVYGDQRLHVLGLRRTVMLLN